jgi:hypothetical protein
MLAQANAFPKTSSNFKIPTIEPCRNKFVII